MNGTVQDATFVRRKTSKRHPCDLVWVPILWVTPDVVDILPYPSSQPVPVFHTLFAISCPLFNDFGCIDIIFYLRVGVNFTPRLDLKLNMFLRYSTFPFVKFSFYWWLKSTFGNRLETFAKILVCSDFLASGFSIKYLKEFSLSQYSFCQILFLKKNFYSLIFKFFWKETTFGKKRKIGMVNF